MKTSLFFILFSTFCFGQQKFDINEFMQKEMTEKAIKDGTYKDLTKQYAFEKFKNSNVRISLGFQLREFNYELISMYAKQYKIPMSKMIIFNNLNPTGLEQIKTAFKGAENPLLCNECFYLPYKATISK